MRTLVVETNATFAALREQLMAGDEPALLLIQPGSRLPNADLLLVLLRRLADREALTVALVSDDPNLRRLATALGLPAFRDSAAAEGRSADWQPARREQIGFAPGEPQRPPPVDQP
jgi:hypothetical protein